MSTASHASSPTGAPGSAHAVTPQRIMQYAWGFAPSLIMHMAVQHRYFDVLESSDKTAAEVASATNTAPRAARAILDALVGMELLTRRGERYALTPESAAFLVSTKPSFHGGMPKHLAGQLLHSWKHLPEIARTGGPADQVNQQGHRLGLLRAVRREPVPDELPGGQGTGRRARARRDDRDRRVHAQRRPHRPDV